ERSKCVPTRSEGCTIADNFATRSGGVARAKRRCDWGIKMCHSSRRSTLSSSACLAAMIGLITLTASAQTPKKESVWDKIKKAGQQGAAQGQQPQQQPQPGQQPAQRQDGRGRPSPPNQSQVNDSGPIKPPAGTKIEEKILAPLQDRAKFEVSPHGVHVATTETDGSRAVVYYDGVEGPKFDEILPQNTNHRVAFSPDGNRYAYCARSGDHYVVMVDGKEAVRSSESHGTLFDGNS